MESTLHSSSWHYCQIWLMGHSTTDQPLLMPSYFRFWSNLVRGVILHAKNIGRRPRSLRSIVFQLLLGAISEVPLVIKYSWAYNSQTTWSINGFPHIIRFAKSYIIFLQFQNFKMFNFEIVNSQPFFVDLTWPLGPNFFHFLFFQNCVCSPVKHI